MMTEMAWVDLGEEEVEACVAVDHPVEVEAASWVVAVAFLVVVDAEDFGVAQVVDLAAVETSMVLSTPTTCKFV